MSLKKRAFTLVEILMVIVIVGILLVMTMDFWWQQISRLRKKTIQERFVDRLNTIQNQVLASNRYEGKKFSQLQLTVKNATWIQADITWSESNVSETLQYFDRKHTVEKIRKSGDDETLSIVESPLYIIYTPYHFWCVLRSGEEQWDRAIFQTTYRNTKTCYTIVGATCKYYITECE